MELNEQSIILLICLVKIYDNYITPLNTRVKCWKIKKEEMFILGISILEFDASHSYVSFVLSSSYWSKFNIIELTELPPDFKWAEWPEIKERLLKL